MSNKTWNAQELLQLCPHQVIDEARVYIKTIQNKLDRILFAVEKLDASVSSHSLQLSSEKSQEFRRLQLEVEIYFESIAHNLHSLADVLAHIIYKFVIEPFSKVSLELRENQINIKKVKEKLRTIQADASIDSVKQRYVSCIADSVDSFVNLAEFNYTEDLVNTIKHRKLLDTEFRLTSIQGKVIDLGFFVEEFEKDERNHSALKIKNYVETYRITIIDTFFSVGNSINDYCRASYISRK